MTTRQPNMLVLIGGFGSSLAAVALVAVVNSFGFNIMGLHFWFIVPAGALIVGMVSGLGYAACSKGFNVKIRPDFLWLVVAVSILTYILSHGITYLFLLKQYNLSGSQFTFVDYVRDICENTTYQSSRSNLQSFQLGAWGYLFQFVEMVGFSLGSMVPLAILGTKPYCDHCQLYMDKVKSVYQTSDWKRADFKATKGKKEKTNLIYQAAQQALAQFSVWWNQAQTLSWPQLDQQIAQLGAVKPKNAVAWVQSDFYLCKDCENWHMVAHLWNVTLNAAPASKEIHDTRKVPPVIDLLPQEGPPPGNSEGIQESR